MNPVLLFKKGITQVTHLLLREGPVACSSHASIPLVRASKQESDSCNLFLGLLQIAFGEITVKTGKLDNFKLLLPFPTDSSCADLFQFKY